MEGANGSRTHHSILEGAAPDFADRGEPGSIAPAKGHGKPRPYRIISKKASIRVLSCPVSP